VIWWLGSLGAFIALMFLVGPHFKRSEAFPYIALAGFLLTNFIGVGLGTRSKGETTRTGVQRGLLFGGQWLAMWGAFIAAAALLVGLYLLLT
jgi:hypothetical protein